MIWKELLFSLAKWKDLQELENAELKAFKSQITCSVFPSLELILFPETGDEIASYWCPKVNKTAMLAITQQSCFYSNVFFSFNPQRIKKMKCFCQIINIVLYAMKTWLSKPLEIFFLPAWEQVENH